MSVVRILFLGTPDFAVPSLEALHRDEHFEIVKVITQPDRPAGRDLKLRPSPVKQKALELGLEVMTPEKINTPEVLAELQALSADSAVVIAFGQILSPQFLKLFPHPAVNVHSSLLPRWRGAAPMQRALLSDDKETGVALQVIVPELDAGPVLGVRRVALSDDVDILKLYEKLRHLSCELVTVDFMDYIRGNLTAHPQDPTGVTIAKKIRKEEGLIDWTQPARQIFNQIRALKGWPGTWTTQGGKTLKVLEASPRPGAFVPGQIAELGPDYFDVGCGQGILRIAMVQPESRSAMKVADYLRGYQLKRGDVLGGS